MRCYETPPYNLHPVVYTDTPEDGRTVQISKCLHNPVRVGEGGYPLSGGETGLVLAVTDKINSKKST